ncbi:hypothetical protein, partial [Methylibium rhizosphaerae]|uniref:hypothetical protein n=1 Tax=Methylibium rhizosphaerae TaxID=2570323 RepID=UPI00112C16DA
GREIWKEIGYGTQPITQGTRLVVPRATDAVDVNDDSFGDLVFEYRALGTADWAQLESDKVADFGRSIVANTSGLAAGAYEYRVLYRRPQDLASADLVRSQGRFLKSSPGDVDSLAIDQLRPQSEQPVVHQTFDRWGNLLSVSDPRNRYWLTHYSYDWGNRLVQVDKPAGDDDKRAVEHTTYDALGRMVASTDALGNVNRL